MIREAVYTILSGDSNVTDEVSTRIYPMNAPQNPTFPFVIFEISQDPEYTKDGAAPLVYTDLDIYIYCKGSPRANDTIADVLKTALDQYSGTVAGHEIDNILWQDTRDTLWNPDQDEYQLGMSFRIREK